MVAILQPNHHVAPTHGSGPTDDICQPGSSVRPVRGPRARPSSSPSHLRLVVDRPGAVSSYSTALVAAGIIGVLLVVVALRVLQGGPPASTWAEIGAASEAGRGSVVLAGNAGPLADVSDGLALADVVMVAEPGDTWWAIAEEFAPGIDTVEVVRVLTSVNGGSSLDAGQQIVIPASIRG